MSTNIIFALLLAATTPPPVVSVPAKPADPGAGECEHDVSGAMRAAQDGATRAVVVFTGTQQQLSPLYGTLYGQALAENLIPFNPKLFALIINLPTSLPADQAAKNAAALCNLVLSRGGRFHGFERSVGNKAAAASYSIEK